MNLDLRSVERTELKYFLTTCEAAFGFEAKDEFVERIGRVLDPARTVAAFDGESMVGTAADWEFVLTVPGGNVPTAGVSLVGVLPSHRRKGVLSRMMRRQLQLVQERGEPLAALWASEGNIYQRFGYGTATLYSKIDLERDRAQFRNQGPATGRMRMLVDDSDKAVDVLAGVYDRVCRVTPGMFERSRAWWAASTLHDSEDERGGGGPLFRAVWELDGRPEAYALYRIHHEWDAAPTGHVFIREALGTTPQATREIWRFLIGIDLVAKIQAIAQPGIHPLLFMLAEPRRLRARLSDALMVRLVDLKAALEARTYSADGSLTIEVSDPLLPHNSGRWRLSIEGGRGTVARTDGNPDVVMTMSDLGSVYLGGFTFRQVLLNGTMSEARPGALWEADGMFRTEVEPWCPEIF